MKTAGAQVAPTETAPPATEKDIVPRNDVPLIVQAHMPTYLLPVSYNGRTNDAGAGISEKLDNTEIKFQLSFKIPLFNDVPLIHGDIHFGYTQLAYWQAYNKEISSPFRETNYQPELFWQRGYAVDLWGFSEQVLLVGIMHQSNGRSQPESRSWDRVYLQYTLSNDHWEISFKPWQRLAEGLKDSPQDAHGDDNPDIEDYLGYGEIWLRNRRERHTLDLMLRNVIESDARRGALQFGYVFPLTDKVRGYFEYFNGYGESLIDYDHASNRVSLGIMLGNWY